MRRPGASALLRCDATRAALLKVHVTETQGAAHLVGKEKEGTKRGGGVGSVLLTFGETSELGQRRAVPRQASREYLVRRVDCRSRKATAPKTVVGKRLDGLHRPRGRAGAEGCVYVTTASGSKGDVSAAGGADCLLAKLVGGQRMRLRLHRSRRVMRGVPVTLLTFRCSGLCLVRGS